MDLTKYNDSFDFEYSPDTHLAYKYIINYKDEKSSKEVKLETLIVIDKKSKTIAYPKIDSESIQEDNWSNLEFCKCENCPLTKEQTPNCPVAVRLKPIVNQFQGIASYENLDLKVESEQRNYTSKTSAQNAIQSLFGLIMGSSGCPILNKFYPMTQFHLPLASMEETLVRTISFHFLNQYINKQNIELDSLDNLYQEVQMVNHGLSGRLRELEKSSDTSKNAVVILNTFAQMFLMEHTMDLEDLKKFF